MVIFMMMMIIIKIIARPQPALSYHLRKVENLGLLETTREATALASVRPGQMHHLISIDYQYHDHVDGNADSGDDENLCQPFFLLCPQSAIPLVSLAHSIVCHHRDVHDHGGVHGCVHSDIHGGVHDGVHGVGHGGVCGGVGGGG